MIEIIHIQVSSAQKSTIPHTIGITKQYWYRYTYFAASHQTTRTDIQFPVLDKTAYLLETSTG
jgi:hypothetical protein